MLSGQVKMWATPDCSDRRSMKSKQQGLSNQVKAQMWPTMESKPSGRSPEAYLKAKTRNKNLGGGGLEVAVKMWPTPTLDMSHHGGRGRKASLRRAKIGKQLNLDHAAQVKAGEVKGSLNADWVSLLQGYPKDWTTLGDQDGKTEPQGSSRARKTV